MKIHEIYINRCLELAKNGLGNTYPNPSVGCVIVHQGKIIGEGYTSKAGGPHAEVNAIHSVADKALLREATLYVTLEPCSHFGKTPPCANLIAEMQIPRVVIGTLDSNEQVKGRGVKKLLESGCDVVVGVLEEACRAANKRFFCFHENQRPYLILKWAESTDGFLAPDADQRDREQPQPVWLSSKTSRQLVHKWRSEEQAILVGTATAITDNPGLTTRDWYGSHPLRITIDKTGKIPGNHHLLNGEAATLIFTANKELLSTPVTHGPEYTYLDPDLPFTSQVLHVLYERGLQSLIIEGGAATLNRFIEADLWDEARVFKSPVTLSRGIKAPELHLEPETKERSGDDLLLIYTHKPYAKK